jgi:hypothetical protein
LLYQLSYQSIAAASRNWLSPYPLLSGELRFALATATVDYTEFLQKVKPRLQKNTHLAVVLQFLLLRNSLQYLELEVAKIFLARTLELLWRTSNQKKQSP